MILEEFSFKSGFVRCLTLAGLLVLTSCGDTQFGAGSASLGNGGDATAGGGGGNLPGGGGNNPGNNPGTPGGSVETPEEIAELCARANVTHMTLNTTLNFPERTNCSFDTGVNGPRINGQHQAREFQEEMINLPANAVLCGLTNFSSGATTEVQYDDFMFITLEDYVLVSTSEHLVSLLESDSMLRQWDWSRIYQQPFENSPTPYCLGATCVFPGHDQIGPIDLNFGTQEMAELSSKLLDKTSASLKVITTGDNDDGDCEHSAFDISLTLDYVVQ